ncbi:MAG: hypothetical protein JM58_09220 [Peptococcaceae bacterium BICA1-8]|nr:MAG: hypothetical protein JM58_09220 [Peptococcaceae bacterium BICA1-8]
MKKISDRIKQLRQENNLTQEEFGKMFGIVKSTVSLYESNKSNPDDELKRKIAKHFNVSLDWLLGLSDKKQPNIETKEDKFIEKISVHFRSDPNLNDEEKEILSEEVASFLRFRMDELKKKKGN